MMPTVEWPAGAALGSTLVSTSTPTPLVDEVQRRPAVGNVVDAEMDHEGRGSRRGGGEAIGEVGGSASRPTSSRNVRLTSAFDDDRARRDAPAVGERDADRAAVFDEDALDARLQLDRAAARLDRFDQDFGEALRAAGRIIAAVEIIAEQRDHLGASQPLASVADVAGQRRERALRLRVGNVARDELVERPVHPLDRERMVAGEGEQGVGAARQAGNAAIVGAGRVHAVVDRLDLLEQRLQSRRVGGELAAEFGGVCAPVARRVDDRGRRSGRNDRAGASRADRRRRGGRGSRRPGRRDGRRRNRAGRRRSDRRRRGRRGAPCAGTCGNSRRGRHAPRRRRP